MRGREAWIVRFGNWCQVRFQPGKGSDKMGMEIGVLEKGWGQVAPVVQQPGSYLHYRWR